MNLAGLRNAYRQVAQFHENEQLIAWVQSWKLINRHAPHHRRRVLFYGALIAGVVGLMSRYAPWPEYRHVEVWLAPVIAFPILLGMVYSLYLAAVHFKRLPTVIRPRPQIWLHLLFWALLLVIWFNPDRSAITVAVVTLIAVSFPYLIWRCGYMLLSGQRGKAGRSHFADHLFYIWPVWDGTNTPPGKGYDNLMRFEAQTSDAYARSVLAGVKLFLLVLVLMGIMHLIGALVYGDPKSSLTRFFNGYHLSIPRLKVIINGNAPVSSIVAWVSLYMELIWETLSLAVKGHVWIGTLRLFGFNVFRNTYKPLLAESVVEFWNRYYYYFKELMMEFFFLPTYLRHFRDRPALRIVVAVFAAAFVGNMYYHLIQAKNPLIAADFIALWQLLGGRLIYCFLLATGIAVSMLRQQRQRGTTGAGLTPKSGFHRLLKIAGVWTFFAVINFWNIPSAVTIPERARLFVSLIGF